jgi:hypothetical protein
MPVELGGAVQRAGRPALARQRPRQRRALFVAVHEQHDRVAILPAVTDDERGPQGHALLRDTVCRVAVARVGDRVA